MGNPGFNGAVKWQTAVCFVLGWIIAGLLFAVFTGLGLPNWFAGIPAIAVAGLFFWLAVKIEGG